MYNKDGTRLQDKGGYFNCLSHILNIKVIYVRHTHLTVYKCHRFRPEDKIR
jgi:hypothetical protein